MNIHLLCTHTHTHTHNTCIQQVGPGIVFLTFKSFLGSGLLFETLTPQEPLLQKYSLTVYADWWIPKFLTRLMISGYDVQVGCTILECCTYYNAYTPLIGKGRHIYLFCLWLLLFCQARFNLLLAIVNLAEKITPIPAQTNL